MLTQNEYEKKQAIEKKERKAESIHRHAYLNSVMQNLALILKGKTISMPYGENIFGEEFNLQKFELVLSDGAVFSWYWDNYRKKYSISLVQSVKVKELSNEGKINIVPQYLRPSMIEKEGLELNIGFTIPDITDFFSAVKLAQRLSKRKIWTDYKKAWDAILETAKRYDERAEGEKKAFDLIERISNKFGYSELKKEGDRICLKLDFDAANLNLKDFLHHALALKEMAK